MTTPDYYQPDVYLNGRLLDTTRRIEDVTALAGLEIEWGTQDYLSDVAPSKLTLGLIDPDGDLLPLVGGPGGDRIELHRAGPAGPGPVWHGELEDAEAELIELPRANDPSKTRWVWLVTLTAIDPLGILQADRKHGPPPHSGAPGPKNTTHWGPTDMLSRKIDLNNRAPVPIRFMSPGTFPPSDIWIPGTQPLAPITGYEMQQNVSVLTVLHRTMRVDHVLSRPYYRPSVGEIAQVAPAPATHPAGYSDPEDPPRLILDDAGGIIDITHSGSPDLVLLRGRQFSAEDGIRVAADPSTRITQVERVLRVEKIQADPEGGNRITYEDYSQTASTGMKAGETMTASFEYDLSNTHRTKQADWAQLPFLQGIYPNTAPGVIVYRLPRQDTPDPDLLDALLRPEPEVTERFRLAPIVNLSFALKTYYLVASITNLLPNCKAFSIVGGKLRYDHAGWTHQLYTQPTQEAEFIATSAPLTLGDLHHATAIGQAAPGLRLADLARATTTE